MAVLEEALHLSRQVKLDAVAEPVVPPVDPRFIEIKDFQVSILVSKADFRINASNVVKLAGYKKSKMQRISKTFPRDCYHVIPLIGTFVEFDIGIALCQKYRLPELEKRLLSLKADSEDPALDLNQRDARQSSESTPASERSVVEVQASPTLPKSLRSTELALNQTRESLNSDSALAKGRRQSQGTISSYSSDGTDPEDEQVYANQSIGKQPVSDPAISDSISSSSDDSGEQESESSRPRSKATSTQQQRQCSVNEVGPRLPPIENSHHRSWASLSQHTQLSLFKPDLNPSMMTPSPYESFTDLC